MKDRNCLQKILWHARPYWDRDETRPAVRRAFTLASRCRTLDLGAEVYGSANEEWTFPHSCKSPACPSCGHRASHQWRRERWAALPDVPYKGITFTMPDVLWPLFRDNPSLAKALAALAAKMIEIHASVRYGLRVGVIAILQTYNGKLEFNSHVHTMVTAGGLRGSSTTWVSSVFYHRDQLMASWRRAVIELLRVALRTGQLRTCMAADEVENMLTYEANRWWSIHIQSFTSKEHFLVYAGRYIRRPPIAQHRIVNVGEEIVTFWYRDKRQGCRIEVQCSIEDFMGRWAQHIPERYQHSVRNFGLFSPRGLYQTGSAVFAILGQKRRPRPKPLPWAYLIKRHFGRDPLVDSTGKRMQWVRRISPNR